MNEAAIGRVDRLAASAPTLISARAVDKSFHDA